MYVFISAFPILPAKDKKFNMKIFSFVILPMLLGIIPSYEAQNVTSNPEDITSNPGNKNQTTFSTPITSTTIADTRASTQSNLDATPSVRKSLLLDNEEEVLNHLVSILSDIEDMEQENKEISDYTISRIIYAFPRMFKLELIMHKLKLIINQINFAERQMRNYLISRLNRITHYRRYLITMTQDTITERKADIDMRTHRYILENFATWITDYMVNILMKLLRKLTDVALPSDDDNVFQLILRASEDESSNCYLEQSIQQTLYNLYNSIALAKLKGSAILQTSYTVLQLYNKGNYKHEAKSLMENYLNSAKQELEMVRKALLKADRSSYKCDPGRYAEGVTHTKLTRLMQGYIENEINFNPDETCRGDCQSYTDTEVYGCYENQFCPNQRQCEGRVINCHSVDSNMQICTSTNPERRYKWVEYGNGKTMGHKGVCNSKNLFTVDSSNSDCGYCLCLCDDTSKESDRYFNLREVTSDIEKNKVVTGLRIVKHNQIFHLQIQQGVLTPKGLIRKSSMFWKPVDKYTIDDNVLNNVHYYTVNSSNAKIDTNEMFGPPEHVVTGVRFRKVGTHLNLQVRVTPINFTSGEVFEENHSYWLENNKIDNRLARSKTEIKLINPDIPTRNGPHTLISKKNQYIRFQPTSFETDLAQTTVPYLDSQTLSSLGFPLSGLGLIHRGKRGSGGFIAPKLISYDFTSHLKIHTLNGFDVFLS